MIGAPFSWLFPRQHVCGPCYLPPMCGRPKLLDWAGEDAFNQRRFRERMLLAVAQRIAREGSRA